MPPRPMSPMIRYRSVMIVPGVKPPTAMESDDARRPTCTSGLEEPLVLEIALEGALTVPVGIWDTELTGVPQAEQYLCDSVSSCAQDRQFKLGSPPQRDLFLVDAFL